MTTLITFLGKGRDDLQKGYRTAVYRFPDGTEGETAYFGLTLARWLEADRIVLLGTGSSMWDVLIEQLALQEEGEALRMELIDAVAGKRVTDTLLASISPLVERAIGRPATLAVIPHARDFGEQTAILELIARQIPRGARVAVDVTHGYRHLAMIGLTVARYLRSTHGVELHGLWYGAVDMIALSADGTAPVLRLDGLDAIQDWVEAFARYEASGNFAVFTPLLEFDGLSPADAARLERAWGCLQTTNVNDASRALRPLLQRLKEPLSGPAELFRDKLRKSLRWAEGSELAEQQRLLALQSLARKDFLRAAIFGLESFLSRETITAGGDPLSHRDKTHAETLFKAELKDGDHADWKRNAYWLLKNVRNTCAHGTAPTFARHAELLRSPERLGRELEATLSRLTNT